MPKKTKLKAVPHIEDLTNDLLIVLNQYGVTADIILQLGVHQSRVKTIGDCSRVPKLTKDKCPTCKQPLRTDSTRYWCTSPTCNYIGVK